MWVLLCTWTNFAKDNTNKELFNILDKNKTTKVLGINFYNTSGQFNEDLKKFIVINWKKIEKYLPKFIKWKVSSNKVLVVYKYNF